MSETDDLTQRIAVALDRIGQGLEGLSRPAETPPPVDTAAETPAAVVPKDAEATETEGDEASVSPELLTPAPPAVAAPLDDPEAPPPSAPVGGEDDVASLRAALEDERIANAQLEERVRVIKSKQSGLVAALEERVAEQQTAMAELDQELARLRAANDQLMETSAALREAQAAGVTEPHLINQAMLAEIEALRARRETDMAEAGAVLAALGALVGEDSAEDGADDGAGTAEEAADA